MEVVVASESTIKAICTWICRYVIEVTDFKSEVRFNI